MQREKEFDVIKIVNICFQGITLVVAVVLLVCLMVGSYVGEFVGQSQNSICKSWEPQWEIREVTSEEEKFFLEQGVKLTDRDMLVGTAKLPEDTENHTYLQLSIVYSDVWFYVGEEAFFTEELRYVFYPEAESIWAKTGYSARRTIPLYDSDGDKYITFLQVADSKDNFISNKEFVYGDKYGLLRDYIRENYMTFLINLIFLVLSFVAVLVGFGAAIVIRRFFSELYLVIGIFFLALWTITNSYTMELLFDNWHLMHDMLYLSDLAAPLAMMLYLDAVQEHRYKKFYFMAEIIYVPAVILGVILYITNVCSLHDYFINILGLFFLQVLCAIGTVTIDVVKKQTAKYKYVLVGFVAVGVLVVIQLGEYVLSSNVIQLPFLSVGVIILLLMCVLQTAEGILRTSMERTAALSASKAKSDVLARMSHEIRTPINAILGMNEMILRTTNELESKEYAEDVKRATSSLLQIVNDILDFSKIESGKMELLPVEYNLANLLRDINNMFKIRAEEKGLALYTHIDFNLPSELYGDDVKLRQILTNILSNAVKYTKEGRVDFTVNGQVEGNELRLHFSVKDTGIGIKPEDMTKLFTEFERIEEKGTRNIEGTGLGMSITTRFLQMMGSELEVHSVYGEGSEFAFDLIQPVLGSETIGAYQEKQKAQLEAQYHKSFVAPEAKVLVVDDKVMNLKVFCSLLRDTHMQIDTAESGEEALKLVAEKPYHMIFLDHMMPEMDGVETLVHLKELFFTTGKEIPVIALTANAVAGAREFYLSKGFDDFLSKPFSPEQLEAMILERLPEEMIEYQEKTESVEMETGAKEEEGKVLPVLEGFDWQVGLSHFKKVSSMMETLEGIYDTMVYEGEKLEKNFESLELTENEMPDFKPYRVQVHSMKGTANLVGALTLGEKAKALENAAREENIAFIKTNHKAFIDEWLNHKEILSILFENKEKDSVTETGSFDKEVALEKLESLKTALSDMDVDLMDEIMKELGKLSFPEEIQKDIAKLRSLVADLEEEEGCLVIDAIMKQIES